ncbi:GIY-YIG nuclease family protein [Streptomyces yangpuensis]|uniref:GIY-YIG nuclease family protein n=1 Tax=Streptomyces yangpuensis TaxID=1648182 RepID=UPI00362A82C7
MTSPTPGGESYVYVIGSAGSTRVKIGTSVSPEKRLKELQTGNPDRLEVLWCTPGGRELEATLHQAFADYRVEGEWFDFGDVQPVGAIPAAVHQRSEVTPRPGRSNTRVASRRSTTRTERGEHLITPERLAGIVRDVVLGVVRSEPELDEDDEQEEVPVKTRSAVDVDMDRLTAFMYRSAATRHARRVVAGKQGFAAFGGWASIIIVTVLTVAAMPMAMFLALRAMTRDIWPVRKLPMLVAAGLWLWGPLGLDKLVRDFVLARLPLEDIETFSRTYFAQAAVTSAWLLAAVAAVMCLMGYAQEVRDHTEEHRAKAKAKAKAEEQRQKGRRAPLQGAQLAAQAAAALALADNRVSGKPRAAAVAPSPLIADLKRAIPQQPSDKNT